MTQANNSASQTETIDALEQNYKEILGFVP